MEMADLYCLDKRVTLKIRSRSPKSNQLQTLQMLWLDKKWVFAKVYHQLKSSLI